MSMRREAHFRSIMKAITWRILATLTTILLVFIFTRELIISIEVGVVEIIVKLFLYYFHERIWELTRFGKERK